MPRSCLRTDVNPPLYFGDMFINSISLNFSKNPRNVHFELNSVFSLSYKISFANSWSLFMERITISSLLLAILQGVSKEHFKFFFNVEQILEKTEPNIGKLEVKYRNIYVEI